MNIRLATEHDAYGICSILRDLHYFPHFEHESAAESEQRVKKHLGLCLQDESHTVYVAESSEGNVVGYVAVHWLPYLMLKGPEGCVSELFVAASERGKGIGAQLLAVVKEEAQKRGCCRLSLLNLRNRESYQRGFYTKQGWTERDAANFVLHLM